MDSSPDKRIVFLAIRPRFAESIIKGEKEVEFRKVRFRAKVSHMVVYASNPVQRVLGYFQVSCIEENDPEYLWNRYNSRGGLSRTEFLHYYGKAKNGVAITVGKIWKFREPVRVPELDATFKIPQNFAYLAHGMFETILNRYPADLIMKAQSSPREPGLYL